MLARRCEDSTSSGLRHCARRAIAYGEVRNVGFGLINGRLFACVYADREAERRVISLRKANRREVERYGKDLE